ncbi:MAG: response regulator [Planctomycetota bacterium]|nr:response regulator [Planctomycetota bacterium]
MTLLFMGLLGATVVFSNHHFDDVLEQGLEAERAVGRVMWYDEVLTMSARMAAATGDPMWEARYRRHEPLLDEELRRFARSAPEGAIRAGGEASDEANRALVGMEHRALELVRAGASAEALALLDSPAYEQNKRIYAAGMKRVIAALDAARIENSRRADGLLTGMVIVSSLMVGVLTIGWVRGFEMMRRFLAEREAAQNARAAAEAAEASSRLKSEFLANMSHEIRTPMTAILGYADLLASGRIEPEARTEAIGTIQRNGRHLLTILNDILDLSKIESGRMSIETLECAPGAVVAEVLSLMRVPAAEKGLELRACVEGDIPSRVMTDPVRLRQILMNLTGNAVKFTEHGSVTIIARERAGVLSFEVRDTGIGMNAEQISRLFRPFTQADASTTRRFGGTGLGLAISKRLAEMLGGTIHAQSAPGLGSAFTLEIRPGIVEGAGARSGRTSNLDAIESERPAAWDEVRLSGRVLVVDDGADNRLLLQTILESLGLTVDTAENGQEALDAMARGRYDAVLMDMQMPVMDGLTAVRALRARGERTPIIAATAHAMREELDRCLHAGCDDSVTKPIDPETLVRVLKAQLERAPARKAA